MQDAALRLLQHLELCHSSLVTELLCLQILAAQDRVDGPEPSSTKSDANGDTKKLVRGRFNKVVERACSTDRRNASITAKCFKLCASFVPENRHEGQDEIRLIEVLARAVDQYEDIGHLF